MNQCQVLRLWRTCSRQATSRGHACHPFVYNSSVQWVATHRRQFVDFLTRHPNFEFLRSFDMDLGHAVEALVAADEESSELD